MQVTPGRDRRNRTPVVNWQSQEVDVSIPSAVSRRRSTRRSIGFAFFAIAAVVPSGVVAFQQSAGNTPAPQQGGSPKLGDSKTNPADGLRYLWIPPGTVTTGCSQGDKECYEDEYPPRKITLTKGFWLGQTEVTQAAFERVMGYNPS